MRKGKDWIMKNIVELFKLPDKILIKILATISIGTSALLFFPIETLRKMGLDNIQNPWRMIIGMAFVISSSWLIVSSVGAVFQFISEKYYAARFKKIFPKVMSKLRKEERKIVALLYKSPNYTSYLPYTDGVTARLRAKYIIELTSNNSMAFGDKMNVPFTITPAAQNYIDENPGFIEEFSHNELQKYFNELNSAF